MLDAVTDYLPSLLDIEAIVGTALDGETEVLRHADEDEPFSALAFKIQTDQHLGKLTYIRVYSGKDAVPGAEQHQGPQGSGSARSTRCTRTSAKSVRAWARARSWPSTA